jgi:hypothetical protein
MNGLLMNPKRAGTARRGLTKKGVLWLTKRIGRHALRGEWQSAHAVAASRDRLLATITDADTGIDAMRAAADEARAVLALTTSGQADD